VSYNAKDDSRIRTAFRVIKCLAQGPQTSEQVMIALGLGKTDTALRHLNAAYDEGIANRHIESIRGCSSRYTFTLNI
jgi:hypothetical protein